MVIDSWNVIRFSSDECEATVELHTQVSVNGDNLGLPVTAVLVVGCLIVWYGLIL